jgi:hypothetical protein
MGYIEKVFGSEPRIAVLRALAEQEGPLSGRDVHAAVAARCQKGHPPGLRSVQVALDDLVKAGVVIRADLGVVYHHTLNRSHPFVRDGVLPLFELDQPPSKDPVRAVKRAIDPLKESLFSALLDRDALANGQLAVTLVARSTSKPADVDRAARTALEPLAAALATSLHTETLGFMEVRDRLKEPAERERFAARMETLHGTSADRLAPDSL